MPEGVSTEFPLPAPKPDTITPPVDEPTVESYIEPPELHSTPLSPTELFDVSTATTDEVVATLTNAKEAGVPDLDQTVAVLRAKRRVGSVQTKDRISDRDLSTTETALDESIILLVQQGQLDLAKALISSNPKDQVILERQADRLVSDEDQRVRLKETIRTLMTEKQRELVEVLKSKGVGDDTIRAVVTGSHDPDSCLKIPQEFWSKYDSFPQVVKDFFPGSRDLAQKAEALMQIDRHGLMGMEAIGLERLQRQFETQEQWVAYLDSFKKMRDLIPEQTAGKHMIEKGQLIASLSSTLLHIDDPEGFTRALLILKPRYDRDQRQDMLVYVMTKYVQDRSDPEAFATRLLESLERAKKLINKERAYDEEIAGTEDPEKFVDALFTTEEVLKGRRSLREKLHLGEKGNKDDVRVTTYAKAEIELQKYGLSLETLSAEEFEDLTENLLMFQSEGRPMEEVPYFRDWTIMQEYKKRYESALDPVLRSHNVKDAIGPLRPAWENLPALRARFAELGIDEEQGKAIFRTWSSYRALSRKMYNDGTTDFNFRNPTSDQIKAAMIDQPRVIAEQLGALTNYAEKYGNDELQKVIDTFGIHNFSRYRGELLHAQLEFWEKGEVPVKNIVASALSDWNGAVNKVGSDYVDVFGRDGLVFFEVGSPTELAEVAVLVGKRDREHGRNPLETNSVENFLIDAHANARSITLGVDGEALQVADYVAAEKDQQKNNFRVNDYRRHLGNRFRLILHACKTAEVTQSGRNIKDAIGTGHDVRVEGSTEITNGAITINPDNTVIFTVKKDGKTDKIPSSTYFPPDLDPDLIPGLS